MKLVTAVACLIAAFAAPAVAQSPIAPTGTLRAVYLGGNPAQAAKDPRSGETVGPAADLTRALSDQLGLPFELRPVANPHDVIDAVATGRADIGFVAYEPSRAGAVEFSQTYELVQQTFIVRENSGIRSIADVDRTGQQIAGTVNDSITLFMRRMFKSATVLAVDNLPDDNKRRLLAGQFDAFSGNRHRMTIWMHETPGTRVLPDDLFEVPQAIVAPKGRPDVLAAIDVFIDGARSSGLIQNSILAAGLVGVAVAPVGYRIRLGD